MFENDLATKKAIEFFEGIQSIVPRNEEGTIDIGKFRQLLKDGDKSDERLKYIYGKIPEFFVRSSDSLIGLYSLCVPLKMDYDDKANYILSQISNGDFSDIDKIEKVYPYIQKLCKFVGGSLPEFSKDIEKKMWKSKEVIPKSLEEEMKKYSAVYEDIVKNRGMFRYKDDYIYDKDMVEKQIEKNPEDKELLQFASKLITFYKLQDKGNVFKKVNKDAVENEKKLLPEKQKKLSTLEGELKEINNELNGYKFFASIFKKKEKVELLKKRDKKQKEIESINRTITFCSNWIKEEEANIEFIENYRQKYIDNLHKDFVPMLKNAIIKRFSEEEREGLLPLVDNIAESYFQESDIIARKSDPLVSLDIQLNEFKEIPFDKAIEKFNNALLTTVGISDIFVEFEKSGNKNLNSLLKNIRGNLSQVPTDEDHGSIEEGFRTKNLRDTGEFFEYTADYDKIEPLIAKLNDDFKELLKEENTENYIKKAGELWYKFVLIHPYADGNGRTGRYLLNTILAHKGFAAPALYNNGEEQFKFDSRLDKYVIHKTNPDFEGLGNEFLNIVGDRLIDLTGEDRLKHDKEVSKNDLDEI